MPEFEFEKSFDNVKAAVEKFGIKYPVIQDNSKVHGMHMKIGTGLGSI